MSDIKGFYATYTDKKKRHEYDLLHLGNERWGMPGILIMGSDGSRWGGEVHSSPTTQKDYDDKCYKAILDLAPAYKVPDFLTHHFEFFKGNNPKNEQLFIKHIQYVILPMIKRAVHAEEYAELIQQWLNNNSKMIYQKHLQEKNEFLQKAYEVAVNYSPSSPLSVDINPREFGKSIGFDEATTRRIMTELVQEGYVTSGLGMHMLLITQQGLNYLRYLSNEQNSSPAINVNIGNNSNFQFQQGTNHSQQHINVRETNPEELKKLVAEIKVGIDELRKYLNSQEVENLIAETSYLENNLQRSSPNPSILKSIATNIWEILKAVPANILSNIITLTIPI